MEKKDSKILALQNKKIPPQAIDFEEGVLGALMIDKNATATAIEILNPECFYKEKHQEIFQVLLELFNDAEPIDLLTVSDKLRKNGKLNKCGGEVYLAELTQKVISSAHIEHHSRIILQKYIQRKLISISSNLINDAFDETTDIIELMDKAESEIFKVTEGSIKKNYSKATDLIHQAIKEIESIGNEEGISGVPSGFLEIDKITSGWQKSDLIIIAARPGMGKTAFVLSMARNIAVDHKNPVALFSLEMNSLQLITRLISSETGLASEKLRSGKMEPFEWEQLHSKIKKIESACINVGFFQVVGHGLNLKHVQDTCKVGNKFFSLSEHNKKKFLGKLVNGKKHGTWKEVYSDMRTLVENYKNGNLEGSVSLFYKNGQKEWRYNYANGILNGTYTRWYKNGQKKREGTYKNGE